MRIKNSRMKVERNKKGLSQQTVADLLGVTDAYISHIEIGRKKPGATLTEKLELFYSLDIKDLLSEVVL